MSMYIEDETTQGYLKDQIKSRTKSHDDNDVKETKLKCCPFCGGEVEISDEKIDATREVYNFHCHNCDMVTFYDFPNDRAEAIEHWNTRKPMDNIVAELKKEKEMAEKEMGECIFKALPYHDSTEGKVIGIKKAIDIVKMEV